MAFGFVVKGFIIKYILSSDEAFACRLSGCKLPLSRVTSKFYLSLIEQLTGSLLLTQETSHLPQWVICSLAEQ